jgi:hypothetical protein
MLHSMQPRKGVNEQGIRQDTWRGVGLGSIATGIQANERMR